MKGTQLMKRSVLAGAMLASVVAGTMWAQTPPASTMPVSAATAPATAPGEEVVAVINGVPVNSKWFDQILMSVGGLRVLQHAIDLVVVEQECNRQFKPMVGPEFDKLVQAEIDRTLDALEEQGVKHEDRTKTFYMLMQRSGVTEDEFMIQMRIQAGLRMLSSGRVDPPTDKEIQDAFDLMYGPRVECRVVTVKTRDEMSTIRKRLENGESFETVMSSTPNVGVQRQIFAESAQYELDAEKQLKAAALAAKEHTLSNPVMRTTPNGDLFHAAYIDKIVPKDASAKLTDPATKAKVEKAVRATKEQRWMAAMAINLHQGLHVDIKDPILSRQYQVAKDVQAATTQAATQPAATAPAPK